jgi:nitrile hydratase
MNGIHDMGGMHGMGAIPYERDAPGYHAAWEGRVYALNRALRALGRWNGHTFRLVRERFAAVDYLRWSYFERWYVGLVTLLVDTRLVTREEIETGRAAPGSPKARPPLTADQVVPMFTKGAPPNRSGPGKPPRFAAGQRVLTRKINTTGHTRLPRYARGRFGTIHRDYGVFPFPDTSAQLQGENPQHVYSVRFAARELWGDVARPQDTVYLDLWDDYLEPA